MQDRQARWSRRKAKKDGKTLKHGWVSGNPRYRNNDSKTNGEYRAKVNRLPLV